MHIFPLPERVKGENGYDLRQSKDYYTDLAPKQLKEYGGDIGGEKEISASRSGSGGFWTWTCATRCSISRCRRPSSNCLVPSIEDFVENMAEIRSYTLECKPKESLESLDKLTNGFDRGGFLKPFADYILYEYRNRRLRTVFEPKDHESALLRLFRKEKSIQEKRAPSRCIWRRASSNGRSRRQGEDKYAPLFLYPVTISRKGIAAPVYSLDVNTTTSG